MKAKYEIVEINKTDIVIDVSALAKLEVMFINATQIAKPFSKKANDFLRLESTQEYIEDIITDSGSGISRFEDLVRVQKGGRYQGTWLHKELALEFAGWCSAIFRRKLHKWVENRLRQEHEWKKNRLESKTGYKPLSDAVKNAHDPVKHYHFSNEANLINKIVLGMSAKEYRLKHCVEDVRENLEEDELAMIAHLQRIDIGLIEIDMSYVDRKSKLEVCFTKGLDRLESLRKLEKAA